MKTIKQAGIYFDYLCREIFLKGPVFNERLYMQL